MAQATLSPSPSFFGESFASPGGTGTSIPTSIPERRRLSHPHNNPPQRGAFDIMAERSRHHQASRPERAHRPRLQHQASQTLTIDLTNDTEEPPTVSRHRARQRGPPQRPPPQLGRSDAQALRNVIDLTDDVAEEPEVEVMSSRRLEPLNAREESPGLFVPHAAPRDRGQNHGVFDMIFGANGPRGGNLEMPHYGNFLEHDQRDRIIFGVGGRLRDILQHVNLLGRPAQPMPGAMDYQRQAFEDRKPDHVPPKPAQEGFTRSPTENETVICPSCEEELVHHKTNDGDEPPAKKGGKAPTKKEREEHPFWVVRDCGHVRIMYLFHLHR